MKQFNRICIFCGSNIGNHPNYTAAAVELGVYLANHNIELVYGGSNVGLMGTLANTVLSQGGKVIGVITDLLNKKVGHKQLTEQYTVSTMHERKQRMFDLSDAFVALPGGIGTLEELFEMMTWAQLGIHTKPCALLNIEGYYDKLIEFIEFSVKQRFIKAEHRNLLITANTIMDLMRQLIAYKGALIDKWIDRDLQENENVGIKF